VDQARSRSHRARHGNRGVRRLGLRTARGMRSSRGRVKQPGLSLCPPSRYRADHPSWDWRRRWRAAVELRLPQLPRRKGAGTRAHPIVRCRQRGRRTLDLAQRFSGSADLRVQLAAHGPFWPAAVRDSRVRAVVLTDGEIDHTLGLMSLREGTSRMPVYAPSGVAALLAGPWRLTRVLEAYSGIDVRPPAVGRCAEPPHPPHGAEQSI
jgi:hypothetical protein